MHHPPPLHDQAHLLETCSGVATSKKRRRRHVRTIPVRDPRFPAAEIRVTADGGYGSREDDAAEQRVHTRLLTPHSEPAFGDKRPSVGLLAARETLPANLAHGNLLTSQRARHVCYQRRGDAPILGSCLLFLSVAHAGD